jgi:hypothetical protein
VKITLPDYRSHPDQQRERNAGRGVITPDGGSSLEREEAPQAGLPTRDHLSGLSSRALSRHPSRAREASPSGGLANCIV